MSTRTETSPPAAASASRKRLLATAAGLILLAAMVYDTSIVTIGSEQDARGNAFSPEAFAEEQFPSIQANIVERAVEAQTLAEAIAADKAAAGEQYGVAAGIGHVIPVTFEGVVGEGKSGIYTVDVEGLPDDIQVRVQTGPAINGTEIRDATGEIQFGQFTNQIEFQNAGAALNNAMKEQVLADVNTADLTGQTIAVTGVFTLINPANWLVTPVELEVQ
jgi:predicted lipoprotein